MKILILTKDKRLGQRLKLLLFENADITVSGTVPAAEAYDKLIVDLDTVEDVRGATIRLSRKEVKGALRLPCTFEKITAALEANGEKENAISLSEDGRWATVLGKQIRLTELESRLLSELLFARDYVSRETLLAKIWGKGVDKGVVNVYVHYLREKLEADGRKIILSSRKCGYKIDDAFKRRRSEDA